MCLKTNCKSIDIVEIRENIRVVFHYDEKGVPIFIQYWDETHTPNTQVLFEPLPVFEAPKLFEPISRTLVFEPY